MNGLTTDANHARARRPSRSAARALRIPQEGRLLPRPRRACPPSRVARERCENRWLTVLRKSGNRWPPSHQIPGHGPDLSFRTLQGRNSVRRSHELRLVRAKKATLLPAGIRKTPRQTGKTISSVAMRLDLLVPLLWHVCGTPSGCGTWPRPWGGRARLLFAGSETEDGRGVIGGEAWRRLPGLPSRLPLRNLRRPQPRRRSPAQPSFRRRETGPRRSRRARS